MAAAIKIAILANAAKARAEMQSVASEGSRLGNALKTGIGFAAVAAGAAFTAFAASSIQGARESVAINKVLESQIKNMGTEAKVAFGGATKFAADYGKQIAKDDDDVLKVINKLSTFPAAFGKGTLGAEGLERATKAAFDLEAAGIGSAESNVIGLGKALDNPIKGLTALSKSGVSFTNEQKEQIKNYVKQGKIAEAQKVLLAGIETNAKGAAAAQASGLDKARVAIQGYGEDIAKKILPALDRFGNWFAGEGIALIETGFGKAKTALDGFVAVVSNPAFQVFAGSILAVVVALKIYTTTLAVIRAATAAWAAVQAVLNVVLTANPIGLIILAIVGLVAAIVIAYKRSETFRSVVQAVWSSIKAVVGTVASFIVTKARELWRAMTTAWTAIRSGATAAWNGVRAIVSGVVGAIRAAVTGLASAVSGAWNRIRSGASSAWNGIKSVISSVVSGIVSRVRAIPGQVTSAFGNAGGLLVGAGTRIIEGLWSGLKSRWAAVKSWFSSITSQIPNLKGPASRDKTLLTKNGELVMDGFRRGLESRYRRIKTSLGSFTGSLSDGVATTVGASRVASRGNRQDTMEVRVLVALESGQVLREIRKDVRVNGKAVLGL